MKIPTHPNRQRIPAQEVCIVLDHSQPQTTHREWAEKFQVNLKTIQSWRASGFYVGLWSAPGAERWEELKAEARKVLRQTLGVLEGS